MADEQNQGQGGNEQVPPPPPPPPSDNQPLEQKAPPPPAPPAKSDKTLMLVLAYFGLLALIPLFLEKDDKEVQWHAKYGLVLFITWFVAYVVIGTLNVVPVVGCFFGILLFVLSLAIFVIHIIAIVQAISGKRFEIPVLVNYVESIPTPK